MWFEIALFCLHFETSVEVKIASVALTKHMMNIIITYGLSKKRFYISRFLIIDTFKFCMSYNYEQAIVQKRESLLSATQDDQSDSQI